MRSGSLFNLIRDKVTASQFNAIYSMVTGVRAFSHPDNFPEDEVSPVVEAIECGVTRCRVKSPSDPLPENIERCL